MNPNLSHLSEALKPYHGTRCEIDLRACELRLTPDSGSQESSILSLGVENKSKEPKLKPWGQGLCVLKPASGQLESRINWDTDLVYGLVLDPQGPFVSRQDDVWQKQLLCSSQFIYPGIYSGHKSAQGPFDLFLSQDQSLLAVSNRSEGRVMVVNTHNHQVVAQAVFPSLAGTKVLSVGLDSHNQMAWVCGAADRKVWRWDLETEQTEEVKGDWGYPSSLLVLNQSLWLLDSYQDSYLHCLNLSDLKSLGCISLEGSSYARNTDSPVDLLQAAPDGSWIAALTHVNTPDPLSPKITVVETNTKEIKEEYQPVGLQWPQLLATTRSNQTLKNFRDSQPLNQVFNTTTPTGVVLALLESYGLNLNRFESDVIITEAQIDEPVEIPAKLRLLVHQKIADALKSQHQEICDATPRSAGEQEIMVQAARLSQMLQGHNRLSIICTHVLGKYTLSLELNRQSLFEELEAVGEELADVLLVNYLDSLANEAWAARDSDKLVAERIGFTDPFNSRIIQLDGELNLCWSLETTLFDVYRPIDVCWLPEQQFAVLDGERNQISCWNKQGKQEWSLKRNEGQWSRMVLVSDQDQKMSHLLLVDGQQGLLIRSDLSGNVIEKCQGLGLEHVRDIAPISHRKFWVLGQAGKLSLYDIEDQKIEQTQQVSGFPSVLALSKKHKTLALFDGQVQKLWIWERGQEKPKSISVKTESSRYRINQALGLQWRNEEEVWIHDEFRVLCVDIKSGKVMYSSLIQSLAFTHGQRNQAPINVFTGQVQRLNQLVGGSRTSLTQLLAKVPMFQGFQQDFLRELVARVRTRIYNKGDLIVQKGDEGQEMFIIRQGKVEVLDPQGKKSVAHMGVGDIFGEVALMLSSPRNASVRAATYCELFSIAQKELDALLPLYPAVSERLLQLAQTRQKQEQLRSESEREKLRTRIDSLLQRRKKEVPLVAHATSARIQKTVEVSHEMLSPLEFWARHTQSGQLALLNRSGEVRSLLGAQQNLVQPVAAINTSNGQWVLDRGLNALILLDSDNTTARLNLEHFGESDLNQPRDLAESPDGALWIANTGKGELLQLSIRGEFLQRVTFGRAPSSIEVLDNGHLLISDMRQHTVHELSLSGEEVWSYGTPRRFGRDENMLFSPEHATRLENGNTLISDTGNSRLLEVDANSRIVWSVSSAASLRMIRPTKAFKLDNGNIMIEHSNHFYWLEVTPEQQQVWRYSLPVKGFTSQSYFAS